MIKLALTLLLNLLIALPPVSLISFGHQKVSMPIFAANVAGLPVSIFDASLTTMVVSSSIELELSNNLSESVSLLNFSVFIYDRNGRLAEIKEGLMNVVFPANQSRHYRTDIDRVVDPSETTFIVLTKIKTASGVWLTDTQGIGDKLKPNRSQRINLQAPVSYEPNVRLTATENTEILNSVLTNLLNDPRSSTYLEPGKRPFLLRESCGFALQGIDEKAVRLENLEDLQAIADRERRVIFLRCEPFEVEGSRVKVLLVLNDRIALSSATIRIPFRFNYRFVVVKRNKNWIVEKLYAYS